MTDMLRVDEQPTWDDMTPRQMQVEIKELRIQNNELHEARHNLEVRLNAELRTAAKPAVPSNDKVLIDALWEQIGRLLVERNTLRQLLIEERERNVRLREREQEEQIKLREETGREHC